MKKTNFGKLKHEELTKKLKELRQNLSEIRFNVRVGSEKNYAQIKSKKRDIARAYAALRKARKVQINKPKTKRKTTRILTNKKVTKDGHTKEENKQSTRRK